MTHSEIICRDLEAHPGSTYLEITQRTGIPSCHRRITGKERPKGWTLRTEKVGRLFVHFATRLTGEDGAGFQGTSVPGPRLDGNGCNTLESLRPNAPTPDPVLSDEPSDEKLEAEARAAAERLGVKIPSVLREANA